MDFHYWISESYHNTILDLWDWEYQSRKNIPDILGSLNNNAYLCNEYNAVRMRRTEIVSQIKEAIHNADPMATAILYGSEARGDARPDSDIDVLVLLEGDKRNFAKEEQISGELYNIELSSGVIISPMILLRKQWENRPFKTPFYVNVMNEGIRL